MLDAVRPSRARVAPALTRARPSVLAGLRRAGRAVAGSQTAWAVGVFLLLAPMIAAARQAALILVAGLLGGAAHLTETYLLGWLPVDPVYGGAGLRVLGGIEPRGLAVAGWPGALLHALNPTGFGPPELVASGAVVSALVAPGVTVTARLLSAVLATSLLVAVAGPLAARSRRPAVRTLGLLTQFWLLLDLAHEADLSLRELEITGLPFMLAALAPVDADGQRVMVTSELHALPEWLIGAVSALLAVVICVAVAAALRGLVALPATLARWRRPWPRPSWRLPSPSLTAGVPRLASLLLVTLILGSSPLGSVAEGETRVLLSHDADLAAQPVSVLDATEEAAPPVSADEPSAGPEGVPSVAVPPVDESPLMASAPTAVATLAPTPAPVGSVVAVEGAGYTYTLRVNGKPTVVRGMGYNPWYADLSPDQRRERYRRDFAAMREIGVNTLEGWFENQFDDVTLEEAQRQGLRVILPFEMNQDYDYSDPAIRERFRQQITAWVLRYRDNPAVLMWGPGNEVMHRLIFPTAVQGKRDLSREKRADDFAAFYVEVVDLIHQLDPNHPVLYRDAEDLYFRRMREALQRDGKPRPWFVYGANVYTQRLAEVIEKWPQQGLDAPLLVSEFSPGGVGPSERPQMLGWYWSTIRKHPKRVIGGVVYTWTTRGPEDLDRVFGLTDETGKPVDGSLAALRRLFREQEAVRADAS